MTYEQKLATLKQIELLKTTLPKGKSKIEKIARSQILELIDELNAEIDKYNLNVIYPLYESLNFVYDDIEVYSEVDERDNVLISIKQNDRHFTCTMTQENLDDIIIELYVNNFKTGPQKYFRTVHWSSNPDKT